MEDQNLEKILLEIEQVPNKMYFSAQASVCSDILSKGLYQIDLFNILFTGEPIGSLYTSSPTDEPVAVLEVDSFSAAVQGCKFYYNRENKTIGVHYIPRDHLSLVFWSLPA